MEVPNFQKKEAPVEATEASFLRFRLNLSGGHTLLEFGHQLLSGVENGNARFLEGIHFALSRSHTARDDSTGVTHSLAWRRGSTRNHSHAGNVFTFQESSSLFFLAAPDFSDENQRLGGRVVEKHLDQSRKLVPMMGSPPIPTQVDWPRPLRVSSSTA